MCELQAAASTQSGFAIVTLRVLVGPDGSPITWVQPDVCKLKPRQKAADFIQAIMIQMSDTRQP